jgi:hypothetical protein
MKIKLFLFLSLVGLLTSCGKSDDPIETLLLISKVWGKPEIVHTSSGYSATTTCGESHIFTSNGSYKKTNDCGSEIFNGTWTWTQIGKEIRLETSFNNIPQRTYILTILNLSNDLLHVKERFESEPPDTYNYRELKYRPRKN